jgi:glucose 1-dehydrogenase
MSMAGRNAIVTGASRGIGRACAIELARQGANVGINFYSHVEGAEEVQREIEKLGRKALLFQGDVADQSFVEEMTARTAQVFGSVDMFVTNAVYSDRQLMIDADMKGIRRTIDVTMWGAFNGCRAAAQQMVKQGKGGSIVIVSSPHAVIPIPTSIAYNMAKAAIDHMARTAAIELAEHKVRVNIVHPGWIDTPGERKFFDEDQLAQGAQKLPWKRLGTSEEVAKAIAFVLSDACDYMTGSTLTIDGGVSLPWWSNRAAGEQ